MDTLMANHATRARDVHARPGIRDGETLMRRVARGESAAFESLYKSHHGLVFGIALRLLGDTASAEDLTQSVFLKVWANAGAFKGGRLDAWISRVARNGGLDVLRQRSTRAETDLPADVPLDGALEDAVIACVDARRVRAALADLPQKERSLIELGYFGGLTYYRVATETGVPLGTVKTRIRSGLHRLREALGDGFDCTG